MSVLLVVEPGMFADALSSVLLGRDVDVVGVVRPGVEAKEAVQRLQPEVVVIELLGRTGRGRAVASAVRKLAPSARVIAILPSDDGGLAREVIALGLHGYVTRDIDPTLLVKAIKEPGTLLELPRRRRVSWSQGEEEFLISQLTPREIEVIRLISTAASSEAIAHRLSISVNTVRSHIQSIFTKLQVHSRLEALAFAARHDLLSPPVPLPPLREPHGRDDAAAGTLSS